MDVDFVVAVEQKENENDQKLEIVELEIVELEVFELEEAELEITHQMVILLARLKPDRRLEAMSLATRILNQME